MRLLYALLSYFVTGSNTFSLQGGSVAAQATMSVAEEWIAVILYLTAGVVAPVIGREQVRVNQFSTETGAVRGKALDASSQYPLNEH